MTRIVCCSVTAAGAALAARLPWEHRPGALAATVRQVWDDVDGLILFCAAGIAVRAVAPVLSTKATDPAVVCVDDAGRYVVALLGGHAAGANDLARHAAALLGAEPVVTTATDGAGIPGLDTLPGLEAEGDVAGVTRRWLDGAAPALRRDEGLEAWPVPLELPTEGAGSVVLSDRVLSDRVLSDRVLSDRVLSDRVLSDRAAPPGPGLVVLRPRSLVIGVGASSGADPAGAAALVDEALAEAGLHPDAVESVATLDRKAAEPALVAVAERLGVTLRTFPADRLADVEVPTPSSVVEAAVGTPSVAEAAALVGAGPGGRLVVTKRRSADATVAVARRAIPAGHLSVVGLGPGSPAWRTPAAAAAVRHATTVMGYGPYVDLAADLLGPGQHVIRSPIGAESDRCRQALERAAGGERVALVCSGDAGVYAMASLVLELAPGLGDPPVTVVPGVTAALAAAAVLGAPLGHDHAAVSLSDLLTPWSVIERRLRAVAEGDLVVSLYNPRSARRTTQLERALSILGAHRPHDTPAAVVTDVGRPGQQVVRTRLGRLAPGDVGMTSLVVVGSSTTRWIGSRMVTPRGYQP